METILITGAAGYIGKQIAYEFVKKGYRVLSLDRKKTGHLTHENIVQYFVDLHNREEVIKVFKENENIGCVIHCAGELGIFKSYNEPGLYFSQNVFCTDCILEIMMLFGVNKIIYASSAAVYESDTKPQSEDSLIAKNCSPYAYGKYISEKKLMLLSQYSNISAVAFRYFNVVGCNDDKKEANLYIMKNNLFPNIVNAAYVNRNLLIYGADYDTIDGTCIRDYIHVKDLALLHLKAYECMKHRCVRGIYNAGTGQSNSVLQVLGAFNKVSGYNINPIFEEQRFGDVPYLCADITKVKEEFNWSPKYTIEHTFEELLRIVSL